MRGRSFNNALEWSESNGFGDRAHFDTEINPTALRVENVQLDDAGEYRCRADFKNNPTRNFKILLNVVGK